MVQLIDHMDKLTTVFRDVDTDFDMDLPELVVIGHQVICITGTTVGLEL